jgi:hypothetical protein
MASMLCIFVANNTMCHGFFGLTIVVEPGEYGWLTTLASTDVRVLVTPTIDLGMILTCMHGKLRSKASIPPSPPLLDLGI